MSKLARPILPDAFPRKRLFNLLDNMRRQPVIWISGPAGCGKTTLVSSYLESQKLPCLWYQIDEGDKDPATFFYYLVYKGVFLAEEAEQSWMISPRERLGSRFIRNLIWLGHYWEGHGEWEKAIESFQWGLEMDGVSEDLYQQLMLCYRQMGRRAEALSIYQRCRKTLSMVLEIDPSPKTEAIYKSLSSGGKL